jgi:hypothetical protein
MDSHKQQKNNQIEKEMMKEAEENEPKRQAEHRAKKDQLVVQRREEKLRKRRVNIEIASELVDMILDVADVAYNNLVDAAAGQESPENQLTTQVFEEH